MLFWITMSYHRNIVAYSVACSTFTNAICCNLVILHGLACFQLTLQIHTHTHHSPGYFFPLHARKVSIVAFIRRQRICYFLLNRCCYGWNRLPQCILLQFVTPNKNKINKKSKNRCSFRCFLCFILIFSMAMARSFPLSPGSSRIKNHLFSPIN